MKKVDYLKALKEGKSNVVVDMTASPEVVTSDNGTEAIRVETNKGTAYLTERWQDIFEEDMDADGELPTEWQVSKRSFLTKRDPQPSNASAMFS